jgi:hypothetical protein
MEAEAFRPFVSVREGRSVSEFPGRPPQRPHRSLPSERIAFSRQLQMLRIWGSSAEDEVMTNKIVARRVGLNASTVSLANPFFASIDLIRRVSGGYVPSPELREFACSMNDDASVGKLAPLLKRSWFAKVLLPALPTDETTAFGILADATSVQPDDERNAQLRLLVDYLEAAEIISREHGEIREGRAATQSDDQPLPRGGGDQAESIVVTTLVSDVGGEIIKFAAEFPAESSWVGGLGYFEGIRYGLEGIFVERKPRGPTASIIVATTISHPSGRIAKFDATLPPAPSWEAALGAYFDGIRFAMRLYDRACEMEAHTHRTTGCSREASQKGNGPEGEILAKEVPKGPLLRRTIRRRPPPTPSVWGKSP